MRTMMIGSGGAVEAARRLGAWVVSPASMGVGLLEFHQMDRMVEAGRAAARLLLEETGGDLGEAPVEVPADDSEDAAAV
jgi:predicted acylesterase/phospholipase RssA